jgi:hypothetical protein
VRFDVSVVRNKRSFERTKPRFERYNIALVCVNLRGVVMILPQVQIRPRSRAKKPDARAPRRGAGRHRVTARANRSRAQRPNAGEDGGFLTMERDGDESERPGTRDERDSDRDERHPPARRIVMLGSVRSRPRRWMSPLVPWSPRARGCLRRWRLRPSPPCLLCPHSRM